MADVGGKEALMMENDNKQVPYTDIQKLQTYLSDNGGPDYVQKVRKQETYAMSFFDLVMLNKTEKAELILDDRQRQNEIYQKNKNGLSPLMVAIWFLGNTSPKFQNRLVSLIRKMVRVGGRKFVEMQNNTKGNAIHYAAFNNAPLEIIELLAEAGGEGTLQVQNNWGNTPCHDACYRQSPIEVIEYLVRKGGNAALTAKNKAKKTPLDMLYDADIPSDEHILAMQRAWFDIDPRFSRVCGRRVLYKTLQWSNRVDPKFVTSNNFVKSILNERFIWPRYQMVMFADLYFQAAIVYFLSPWWLNDLYEDYYFTGIYDSEEGTIIPRLITTAVVLVFCILWFMGRELAQLYSSPIKDYSQSVGNYFDIGQICCLCLTLTHLMAILQMDASQSGLTRRVFFVLMSLLSWIQMLRVVSKLFYSVSVFTYATGQVRSCMNIFYSHPFVKMHLIAKIVV